MFWQEFARAMRWNDDVAVLGDAVHFMVQVQITLSHSTTRIVIYP